MGTEMNLTALLLIASVASIQDKPVDIAKANLPKKAMCVVCTANGEGHGEEKPVAGVMFKGAAYYFCNSGEVKSFKSDPEGYMPPVLPRPMAEFNLKDVAGKSWTKESFKGKLLLVDFMASWCKPCHEIKPSLDKLRAELNAKGFEVLSVSIDEKPADFTRYVAKAKFANPVMLDTNQTWAEWRVKAIPAMYLVKDGQVVHQWKGKPKKGELEAVVKGFLPN
jgi:thiol-disulfide isomerase/thioredoxin